MLVARGQSVDVGVVEERVVAVAPGVGLRRGDSGSAHVSRGSAPLARPLVPGPCTYLGADAQVVVGDELGALAVTRM